MEIGNKTIRASNLFHTSKLRSLCLRSFLTRHQQPFRLWLGVTEYLFSKPKLLDEVIDTAIEDNTFRSDDLEFTFAARVSHLLKTSSRHSYAKLIFSLGLVGLRLFRGLQFLQRPF